REDISKQRTLRAFYSDVVRLQDLKRKFLHCSSSMDPGQSASFLVKLLKTSGHQYLFLIQHMMPGRYNMCWHQKHRTLNIHGKTVGWILPSAVLSNFKYSKVLGKSCMTR
uniref:Uncharacterized protein n=1 Tax=Aegilops tauschii subsp. strangulata TaxID=200361 RepID=A0A452XMZ5_AEGTS